MVRSTSLLTNAVWCRPHADEGGRAPSGLRYRSRRSARCSSNRGVWSSRRLPTIDVSLTCRDLLSPISVCVPCIRLTRSPGPGRGASRGSASSLGIYAGCVVPVTADPLRFSTAGLPEDQRIALWEDHNAQALIAVRCRSLQDTTLEATEINVALTRLQLARVLGNPHVVERTEKTVRQ